VKFLSSWRIQINPFGHKVTPGLRRRERESGLARKCVDFLFLDERDLEVGLWRMGREWAHSLEVAISLQAFSGNARTAERLAIGDDGELAINLGNTEGMASRMIAISHAGEGEDHFLRATGLGRTEARPGESLASFSALVGRGWFGDWRPRATIGDPRSEDQRPSCRRLPRTRQRLSAFASVFTSSGRHPSSCLCQTPPLHSR